MPRAVVVARERVADEHGVVAGGIEPAIGLVTQGKARNRQAVVKGERQRGNEVARLNETHLSGLGAGGGVVVGGGVVHGCKGRGVTTHERE